MEEKIVTKKVKKTIDELIAEGLFVNGKIKDNAELYKEVQETEKTLWYVIGE